jgi:hypothetical protein
VTGCIDKRVEMYRAGYSVERIAIALNYSKSGVYNYLIRQGVQMRPPGRPKKGMNGSTDTEIAQD